MSTFFYDAANVKASWAGVDFTRGGFTEDTFLEVTQVGAMKEITFGADGHMSASRIAAQGATISITLKQTAPLNKELSRIAQAEMVIGSPMIVAPFLVTDRFGGSANFVALNAVMTSRPDITFGNQNGDVTWIWTCEAYIPTDDPVSATIALANFIRGA